MSYASGQLILANDFNTIFANPLNTIWNVGSGAQGFGQPAINTVAANGKIFASQWSDLITKMNTAYRHETNGLTSSVTAPSAGTTIGIISNLVTTKDYVIANYASSTLTGAAGPSAPTKTTSGWQGSSRSISSVFTFPSGYDYMRYFFNCGGTVNFGVSYSGGSGTAKSNDWATIISTLGSYIISKSNFYSIGTSTDLRFAYGTSATYGTSANYGKLYAQVLGNSLTVAAAVYDTNDGAYADGNDAIATLSLNATTVYPSTAYLAASWGTTPTWA